MGRISVTTKRVLAAAFFFGPYIGPVFKWIDKILGWGGSVDLVISRSENPGWVGTLMSALLDPPEIMRLICLLLAIWLLLRAERDRSDRRMDVRVAAALSKTQGERLSDHPPSQALPVTSNDADTLKRSPTAADLLLQREAADEARVKYGKLREKLNELWECYAEVIGTLREYGALDPRTHWRTMSENTYYEAGLDPRSPPIAPPDYLRIEQLLNSTPPARVEIVKLAYSQFSAADAHIQQKIIDAENLQNAATRGIQEIKRNLTH